FQLQRLAGLQRIRLPAIDDPQSQPFQVGQKGEGGEEAVSAAAQRGGRTHAVENQRIVVPVSPCPDIVEVLSGVDFDVGDTPPIQFGKQGTEPIGVLIVDGKRFGYRYHDTDYYTLK